MSAVRSALPDYLLRQRWYPAKDAGVPVVSAAQFVPVFFAQMAAALAVWTAEPPGRAPIRLFLPLAIVPAASLDAADVIVGLPNGTVVGDAFAVDDFVRAFVRSMVEPTDLPSELRPGRTAAAGSLGAADEWTIHRSRVEQSNTSIRIGSHAILKVIRKLLQGINPELEMGRFLTERAHFAAIPALLGWLDVDGSTVGVLQAFVPNEGDGWSWIANRLRDRSGIPGASGLDWIGRLGTRTAQLHLALATPGQDPDFDPEVASAADWQRWKADILGMAEQVRAALQGGRDGLEPESQRSADRFMARGHMLGTLLDGLLPAAPVQKTRHHGDYHLGQVLVSDNDVVIVDFEGEPLRPLAERRAKQVPLRDVAGMLRSFGYAAAVAQRDHGIDRDGWYADAARTYVESYVQTLAAESAERFDAAAAQRLITFFTIEKALYEVLYELANRPLWVAIPLRGLHDLLETPIEGSRRFHTLPQGATLQAGGGVQFRLWAPGCKTVEVALYDAQDAADAAPRTCVPMAAGAEGWQEVIVPAAVAGPGTRYRFRLPDGMCVPDPASRFQPADVHGPSEVIDPAAYAWGDAGWRGRPWHEAIVYELHVGTFTPAGTFRAAIERLDHLVALGVTAIELMPIADFPGGRNWGYDGVLPYAPDSSYGRPDDLKALVDAAHARQLMILLDVVYNHFGPDGNYLPVYAPAFFTDRHKTPWGAGINYDGPHSRPVREFVIHNALYWLEEYNFDGLRLDAVHAIMDDSAPHVLDELAQRARALGRSVHLILENEENQAKRLQRAEDGRPLDYTAQWNDDVHHVLHVAATGEDKGYYADYLGATVLLGRALSEGFAFQGQMMEFRGAPRGEPSALLPPTAFVAFIQNHDQIGNRAFGERLGSIAPPAAIRALAALYLLLPQVPMMFMGEEWGAAQPFPFFCDFDGELADAVRQGRRQEFAKFPEFQDEAMRARIPDPQAEATFMSAKLDWHDLGQNEHAACLTLYGDLLRVRRESLWPLLVPAGAHAGRFVVLGPGAVLVRWQLAQGAQLSLAANLSAVAGAGFPPAAGRLLWQEGSAHESGGVDPWFVRWSLE